MRPPALGQGRLSHACLSDVDGVVLPAPAEHLHGALQLVLAPDQRVDAPVGGPRDQVDAVGGERIVGQAAVLLVALGLRVQLVVAAAMRAQPALIPDLQGAVGDETGAGRGG